MIMNRKVLTSIASGLLLHIAELEAANTDYANQTTALREQLEALRSQQQQAAAAVASLTGGRWQRNICTGHLS